MLACLCHFVASNLHHRHCAAALKEGLGLVPSAERTKPRSHWMGSIKPPASARMEPCGISLPADQRVTEGLSMQQLRLQEVLLLPAPLLTTAQ
jgi:hypothetical protein